MAFQTDWDVEKYKSEFESDEHWQLRKQFMQVHKNEFPEDKLVCLARVFCNIEFLGCRYPEKTMKLVADLSKGVADDYREKQKGKLKRTFVQASDAAGAKVKGRGATPLGKITEGPPNKISKTSDGNPSTASFGYTCFVHESLVKPVADEGEFPGFIIYESCKTSCPISILTQSAQKSKRWNVISFDFPEERNSNPEEKYCEITLNQKLLSSAVAATNKAAKTIAAIEGLNKLRKTCYTIQEKLSFFSDEEMVSKDQVVKGKAGPAPLPEDNVGSRMMMRMGWTGAGLGKHQQGIQAPIEAQQTMRRTGLGHLNSHQFHDKFRNVFRDYIASGSTNDLVFAPDFSSDERKILHRIAQNMNLKTKSHGKNEQRQLVVYKIWTLQEILDNLLRCGGENNKYSLRYPGEVQDKNSGSPNNISLLEKENPNVSVKTNTSDSTTDKTTRSLTSDFTDKTTRSVTSDSTTDKTTRSVFENKSCQGAKAVKKFSVEQTGSMNKELKCGKVESICLNSNENVGFLSEKPDCVKSDLARGSVESSEEYEVYESDISVINRVIDQKKEEIATLQTGFEELLDIYEKKKCFTKKQRRKYNLSRRLLQNITGVFILNVLQPNWKVEDFESGNVPKNELLTTFGHRSGAVGLAEAEKSIDVKKQIIRNVKRKLKTKTLIDNRITRKKIRLECQEIGSKLVSDALYQKKPTKTSKNQNNRINKNSAKNNQNNSINKKPAKKKNNKKNNLNKKKAQSESNILKTINFVKERGEEGEDELSGMEYSDDTSEGSDVS